MNQRWDSYFLQMAMLTARMSKDPSTQVGAVIVGAGDEVISTGFNGFPRGIEDRLEWLNDRPTKYDLVVHAEMNAVLNACRTGAIVHGSTIYLVATNAARAVWGGAPCTRCTVHLVQAGIAEVVTLDSSGMTEPWKTDNVRARQVLEHAGIGYREVGAWDRLSG